MLMAVYTKHNHCYFKHNFADFIISVRYVHVTQYCTQCIVYIITWRRHESCLAFILCFNRLFPFLLAPYSFSIRNYENLELVTQNLLCETFIWHVVCIALWLKPTETVCICSRIHLVWICSLPSALQRLNTTEKRYIVFCCCRFLLRWKKQNHFHQPKK